MRRPHYLRHNKGSEYPQDVIVVDTETKPVRLTRNKTGHRLSFGWAFYARRKEGDEWMTNEWRRFSSRKAFWSWALSKVRERGKLTIYCHNAEFDAQVVNAFGELRRRRWRLVSACLEGPPTIIKWRRGSRSVQWLDSLNIWPVPLKELGKRIGLPKLRMPKSWGNKKRDDAYCRRDVEIVWHSLLGWWGFLREHDLGNAMPTIAGQAFSSYRHRFMSHPIFIDANEPALSLARSSYVGGRCECFRIGLVDEPGVSVDVNAMYPFVMRELLAPARLLTYRTTASLDDVARYLKSYALVAEVDIETEEPAYPHIVGGRLCFPVGRFRQALATPELAHAMSLGRVKRVLRVAVYERAELFREFIEWGHSTRLAMRASGAAVAEWHLKRLQNAFYGKWGQRARQWEVVGKMLPARVRSMSSFDIDAGKWRKLRQLGDTVQELLDKGEAMNSHPAIAAHVTSAARMHLWRLMQKAGRENIWYCDTDNLRGAALIEERLAAELHPDRLGGLKVEERTPWAVINGAKDYETPSRTRRKGVRASAQSNDGVAYLQEQWHGWAGSIARGALDMPTTSEIVKVLSREYSKGDVGPDGVVSPLRLDG